MCLYVLYVQWDNPPTQNASQLSSGDGLLFVRIHEISRWCWTIRDKVDGFQRQYVLYDINVNRQGQDEFWRVCHLSCDDRIAGHFSIAAHYV